MKLKAGILTVSDRCTSGIAEDTSGPALVAALREAGLSNDIDIVTELCPDEAVLIHETVVRWVDEEKLDLVLTTGGTGLSPRDVTPEAIKRLLDREAPGLTATMLNQSLMVTPMAALSRPVCGTRKRTIICTLPGSKKGSTECLTFIIPVLRHALNQIKDVSDNVHSRLASGSTNGRKNTENGGNGMAKDMAKSARSGEGVEAIYTHTHAHTHNCPHTNEGAHIHSAKDKATFDVGRVAFRYRNSPYALTSVDDAMKTVEAHTARLGEECRSVLNGDALHSVAFKPVTATTAYPPFAASVKDGYAVISTDPPGVRDVLHGVIAGSVSTIKVTPGSVARITTGAPIPEGADAVVQVEDTEIVESSADGRVELKVRILAKAMRGQDIRQPGSDIKPGERIIEANTVLGDCELGLLAMVGTTDAVVYKQPRVAILSTGNELHPHQNTSNSSQHDKPCLPPGQIYDSNKVALMSAVRMAGGTPVDVGVVGDNRSALKDAIAKALKISDIVVTTGGVSMGETDLIKPVLQDDIGADIHFGRVFMKPGKPATFATYTAQQSIKDVENYDSGERKVLFFGLPGNPVSAMVTFHLFVHMAIRKLSGHVNYMLPTIEVKLSFNAKLDPRPEYHRATVHWDHVEHCFIASSTGSQCSSRLLSMKSSNVLIEIPPLVENGVTELPAGTIVKAILIGSLA
eukprot:CFRG7587T1